MTVLYDQMTVLMTALEHSRTELSKDLGITPRARSVPSEEEDAGGVSNRATLSLSFV